MLRLLDNMSGKGGLIGELAGMAVEVCASPLVKRTADLPAGGQIIPSGMAGQHGEGAITDTRDGKPFTGSTK